MFKRGGSLSVRAAVRVCAYVLVVAFCLWAYLRYFAADEVSHYDDAPMPHREFTTLSLGARVDLFLLLENLKTFNNGWLRRTNLVQLEPAPKTFFLGRLIPLRTQRVNLLPYLSADARKTLHQQGLTEEATAVVRPSWNLQLADIACEITEGLEPKAPNCVFDPIQSRLRSASWPHNQRLSHLDNMRGVLGHSGWSQSSHAVLNTYRYFTTSAPLLGQWLCTGNGRHWSAEKTATAGTLASRPAINFGVAEAAAVQQWGQQTTRQHRKPLLLAIAAMRRASEATTNTAATEALDEAPPTAVATALLLQKVRIWAPLVGNHATEQDVLDALLRPSVLCAVLTDRRGVLSALLQHRLWGHQCDGFVVFYTLVAADAAQLGAWTADEAHAIHDSGIRPDLLVRVHLTAPQAQLSEAALQWHVLQEAVSWIEDWNDSPRYAYFYMATTDVYAIPENLYALLLRPEYMALNAAGTPLLLGNRMVTTLGTSSSSPTASPLSTVFPFISTAAGFVLNQALLRLLAVRLPSGACGGDLLLDGRAIGPALAQCAAGVAAVPRDTADELGEDRFIAQPLPALLRGIAARRRSGSTGTAVESDVGAEDDSASRSAVPEDAVMAAYFIAKPKAADPAFADNPTRLIAASTVAFAGVDTPERMIWYHRVLREDRLP